MLTRGDSELADRDPALPGLGLVLDEREIADRLAERLGGGVSASADYVRYKPATSCLVGYRLELEGGAMDAYARAHRPEALEKLDSAHRATASRNGAVVLGDVGVAVHLFPSDRRLRSLARFADDEQRRRLLAKVLPDQPWLWPAALEPLRYKPERRFVARLRAADGRCALLKAYAGTRYAVAKRNVKVLGSQGELKLPRRLGRSDRERVLVCEWLPGRSLEQELSLDAVAAAGAALVELHRQRSRAIPRLGPLEQARRLDAAARAVAAISPDLAMPARRLATQAVSRAVSVVVPIHGDLSADQILIGGDGVGLIDLDQAGWGDPAADLGSFAARLEYDIVTGRLGRERADAARAALLEAYRAAGGGAAAEAGGVARHTAAALLRLAPEPFRYRSSHWPQRTRALIERAGEVLADA